MALSKFTKQQLSFPDIREKPHQPFNFSFPKRECGKKTVKKSLFQASWFTKHMWLHYDEERDLAFCHTCVRTYKEKKITWSAGNLSRVKDSITHNSTVILSSILMYTLLL